MVSTIFASADTIRVGSAAIAVVVLFLLAVGLVLHGDEVSKAWRMVLWAVVGQQAVNAYALVVRATHTPAGFPVRRPDLPLLGVLVSLVLLAIAAAGVFVDARTGRSRR